MTSAPHTDVMVEQICPLTITSSRQCTPGTLVIYGCYVGGDGLYWSSTASDDGYAYGVYFNSLYVTLDNPGLCRDGFSVRLITECQ